MTQETPISRGFSLEQVTQLLRPVHEKRVIKSQGHSHLAQQDVRAHLIRMFGFGNFDIDVRSISPIFEEERVDDMGKPTGKWDICYEALVRLTIRDPQGNEICHYEDVAAATAQNQKRGEAHGLARKSAVSYAIKRCATNLGDQFGLSLYNNGQETALVKATKVFPEGAVTTTLEAEMKKEDELQLQLEPQLSLGLTEDSEGEVEEGVVIGDGKPKKQPIDRTPSPKPTYTESEIENAGLAIEEIQGLATVEEVQKFFNDNPKLHDIPYNKVTLKMAVKKRIGEINGA